MTKYTAPKLTPAQQLAHDQGQFNFLCPFKEALLRPDQVATSLGRKLSFVYQMIDEGKLEAHAPEDREKKRYVITKRSTLLLIASTANYAPADFDRGMEDLVNLLTSDQLLKLIQLATARRARMSL